MTPLMEDHLDIAPHENVIKAEVVNDKGFWLSPQVNITEAAGGTEITEITRDAQITTAEDLSIVKSSEVRKNYETSQEALVKYLSVGEKLLNQISDNLDDAEMELGNQHNLYKGAGTLIKALTDAAKTLVVIHQDAGSLFGDVKKIEIDNSQNTVSIGPESLQQLADLAKKHNGISVDG